MTPKQSRESRDALYFRRALAAVASGSNRRQACRIARLPLSTFQDRLKRHYNPPSRKSRTHLRDEEEERIFSAINKFAERCVPMTRVGVADSVQVIMEKMDPARAESLPFHRWQAWKQVP